MGIPLEIIITLFFVATVTKKWKDGSLNRNGLKLIVVTTAFFTSQFISLIINWKSHDSLQTFLFVGLATVAVTALLPMSWVIFVDRFTPEDRWIGLGILLFVHLVALIQLMFPDLSKSLIAPTLGSDGIRPGAVNSIMSATTVYGTFSAITLVFSITGLTSAKNWTWSLHEGLGVFYRFLFMFIALLSVIGGILSGSRNFIWSALVGCTYIALAIKHTNKKLLLLMLLSSLILLHLVAFTNKTIGSKLAMTLPYIDKIRRHQDLIIKDFIPQFGNGALSNRLSIWKTALDMWQEKPLMGHGPGSFRLNNIFPQRLNVHNFYLQTLAESGIITFLIFLILVFLIFKTIRSSELTGVALTAMAALVFDNFLDYSPSWVLALAYMLSWPLKQKEPAGDRPFPATGVAGCP
ncbi:O-antigen ligase family protein [Thermodesulforhabdus norvegica]|nr:O-antigen ligase family protein [Thermodesulforhabdus norvegica]